MKMRRHLCRLTLFVLLTLVSSCGRHGVDEQPKVKILAPFGSYTVALGESFRVESRSRDDNGVNQVELRVDGVPMDLYDVPKGEKSFRVEQSWTPSDTGSYEITVIAYDSQGQASEPATITLTVQTGSTPGAPAPPTVTPTALPFPTSEARPAVSDDCTYDATFITDVTIPDNTPMAPGAEFVKTWRLRNSGTCDWDAGVQLEFIEGERMGAPSAVNPPPTPAGTIAEISVLFQAPQEPGVFRGIWRMRAPDGRGFGERPFVQIKVGPSGLSAPPPMPPAGGIERPDLDVLLVPANLELSVGQPMELAVTVRNHGPGRTDRPARVRATLETGLEIEGQVPALPAGGQGTALLAHTFDAPATLEMLITVDPDGEIAETDEGNNTERTRLTVNP